MVLVLDSLRLWTLYYKIDTNTLCSVFFIISKVYVALWLGFRVFIESQTSPQITSCHHAVSYDILVLTTTAVRDLISPCVTKRKKGVVHFGYLFVKWIKTTLWGTTEERPHARRSSCHPVMVALASLQPSTQLWTGFRGWTVHYAAYNILL